MCFKGLLLMVILKVRVSAFAYWLQGCWICVMNSKNLQQKQQKFAEIIGTPNLLDTQQPATHHWFLN